MSEPDSITPASKFSLREFVKASFVTVLVIVPIPLGSNRAWAWSILCAVSGFLILLLSLRHTDWMKRRGVKPWLLATLLPATLVLVWCVIQATWPLPSMANQWPWSFLQGTDGRLSASPVQSIDSLMIAGSSVAGFLLGIWLSNRKSGATLALTAIMISGALDVAFGFLNDALTGSMRIFFFERFSAYKAQEGISGFFVYKNAFACHTALAALSAFFLLQEESLKHMFPGQSRLRGVLLTLISSHAFGLWYFLLFCFLLAGVFAADSRLVSLSTAFIIPIGLFSAASRFRTALITLFGAAAALISAMLMNSTLMARFITLEQSISTRVGIYEIAIKAILERPLSGYGLGSFKWIFWNLQPATEQNSYQEVHSTALEAIVSLGIPAFAILLSSFLIIGARISSGWHYGGGSRRWSAFGWSLLVFLTIQATLDFSLQIPAVSYTMATLLGVTFVKVGARSETSESSKELSVAPRGETREQLKPPPPHSAPNG